MQEPNERRAVSDKRDGASTADDDAIDDIDAVDDVDDMDDDVDTIDDDVAVSSSRGQTAVATRPQRPTGKRTRRAVISADVVASTDSDSDKNGDGKGKKPKTAKKKTGPSRNPISFIWNFLKQVVAELRKVIWPNRKQMISYTTVVLVFLAFMVALIGGVDLGLAKLVTWVFG